ncbi:3230_t:CDS:2, partial [Ambispora leptoticha]
SVMSQQDSVTARVVFVTCPDESVAKKLSNGIVKEKLAACVNIIHGLTSIYCESNVSISCPEINGKDTPKIGWEGKLEETTEHMLVIKTEEKHIRELTDYVNKNHGYEVPEVISIK